MKRSHYLTLGAAVAAFASLNAVSEIETSAKRARPVCSRDADETDLLESDESREVAIEQTA